MIAWRAKTTSALKACSYTVEMTADNICFVHKTLIWLIKARFTLSKPGRTHRSNQVSAPEYLFLISELAGERRFASIVAKRLESLVSSSWYFMNKPRPVCFKKYTRFSIRASENAQVTYKCVWRSAKCVLLVNRNVTEMCANCGSRNARCSVYKVENSNSLSHSDRL